MTALPNDRCLYCTGTASKHDTECKAKPVIIDKEQQARNRQVSAQMVVSNLRAVLSVRTMTLIELAVVVAAGLASEAQAAEFDQYASNGMYTLEKLGLQ